MTALNEAFDKNQILEAALNLISGSTLGHPVTVFPVPPGTKKSHKSAEHSGGRKWGHTRDADEIKRDWARWPDANVGIPTGKENNCWVLETDTRAGGHAHDGEETLAALVAQHGPIPTTLMARSPSGSIHYYFLWPDDGGPDIKNSAGAIGPGVDVRASGGMVIAPPSIRPTNRGGGCYQYLNLGTSIASAAWLVDLARAASKKAAASASARRDNGSAYCDVDRLAAALKVLDNPDLDWESWNKIIMAIYAATGGTSQGFKLAIEWSAKSAKHDGSTTEEKWRKLGTSPPTEIGAGYIFAQVHAQNPNWDRISRDDFYAHMASGNYLFLPTMEYWPANSVNAQLGFQRVERPPGEEPKYIKAHQWLGQYRSIQQTTWQPGLAPMIEHRLLTKEGVWVDHRGARSFNFYRPSTLIPGDGRLAGPWFDVVDKVVGDNRPHVMSWFAHCVQQPDEKINHCLVFGGDPGVGKDSMIEPLRRAVGPHNFSEVDPARMLRPYNRWLQAVLLRISEARDLGDINRYQFYERLKEYTASPPDTVVVEEKYIPSYPIANCVNIVVTTNHKDGLYIPANDRRCHVSWSDAKVEDIGEDFFNEYWTWLNAGGDAHVAAYLRDFDISRFNAKAPPPKTDAFWEMVEANTPSETGDIANVIDVGLGSPDAFNNVQFINAIPLDSDLRDWAQRNKKILGRRVTECGYVQVRNPNDTVEGRWRIGRHRTTIYARSSLTRREQIAAARRLIAAAEAELQNASR
jgi:hypothetical protein